ncbi:MAG: lipopolysaccharide biosynthesis protein [Ruminococcaceae bacterium]|nr:lipopolysaccharide biosynthesis protein [Oscillospiraceae bacterium]
MDENKTSQTDSKLQEELQSASKNTKEKTLKGLFWGYMEKLGGEAVSLIVSIVLARLLGPSAYGIIPLITVFTGILNVIVQGGFASALIQKKNADQKDFSTVFFFQLGLAGLLFTGMFFAATPIANFYNNTYMIPMIRVLSLTLIIGAINNVQHAYVSKTMQFKKFFFASFTGTVVSGIVGVALAFIIINATGNPIYGAWALIAQKLTDQVMDTIFLWFTVKWRPKFIFSFNRLKGLFSYGWKILASTFIDSIYKNLNTLIIGKAYTTKDLAYYNKGTTYPQIIMGNLNNAIQHVLFPAMSSHQEDVSRVKSMTRRAMKTSSYLVFPAMMGFAAVGSSFIYILLGEAWMPAVPFLWIACFNFAMWPIHTTNLQAIQAMGKSGTFLVAEIIKKVSNLIFLGAGILIAWSLAFENSTDSVIVIALSSIFAEIVCVFVNAWPNKRIIGYGLKEQLSDILPAILLSTAMGAVLFGIGYIPLEFIIPDFFLLSVVRIIIQVIIGIALYILLSKIFKVESFTYIKATAKEFMANRKKKKADKKA